MHPFTALQLCDLCALLVCATTVLVRDPTDRGNRNAALLLYSGAFWASCQLLWNTTADAGAALALVRLSAAGWVTIGPLAARFILDVTGAPAPRLRKALPYLFAFSFVFAMFDWLTPWVHASVSRTEWGWTYSFGWAYPAFYVLTVTSLVWGIVVATRVYRVSKLESERTQGVWIAAGIGQLLAIGSTTDGLLPWLGRPSYQLATTAYAVMAVIFAWSLNRFGYSILSPGTFARQIAESMSEGLALVEPPHEVQGARAWLFAREGQRIPVSVTATILRDGRGVVTGLAVVMRDLREIDALQQRLVLSARMVAVGQLAAGVAHEVNNPTAYVRSNMLLLREYWANASQLLAGAQITGGKAELLSDGAELIDESLEGIERIASIVQQIGRFTHADAEARELADLGMILESALRMAKPRLGDSIRVERASSHVPPLECAPRQLEQVFLNLLVNAADAIGDSGTVRISTSIESRRARVDVADDGAGIDPAHLARVFDPFFTTKPVGKGTGLGLSICYEIVQRHGGEIAADSERGRGTVFSVWLPLRS